MRYLICLILVVSTSLHAGTIQKWVDENGNVHYGDAPPVSAKSESISVQSAPSNPGKALPRLPTEQADGATGTDSDAAADPGKVPDEQAQSICESARNDLNIISTSNRIQLKQLDGTTHYLSADEIAERKAKSQTEVDRYCN
ncbi:MAG: DUF4124 domain-containing protein [Gammaproteobacteria bacterium]|nr:DUF4124 domain-containing protein [Gammaproteobacteria bacterium]